MIKRPMLAATWDRPIEEIEGEVYVSPKLDGIRVLIHPELGPVTRSFKPVPNKFIRDMLGDPRFHFLDGEIMLPTGEENFNDVQSAVMSRGGQPDFVYHVFDHFAQPELPWLDRLRCAELSCTPHTIKAVEHYYCAYRKDILHYEKWFVQDGYEGIMLRDPFGKYKSGRSTLREGGLIKLKRFQDAEGIVIGVEEKMHNTNEDIKDEFGLANRTSHKAGMEPTGVMGALVLGTEWGDVRVGTGFDDAQRQWMWDNREEIIGRRVRFKFQEIGRSKPRFPVFLAMLENE